MKVSIFDTFDYGKETIAEIKQVTDQHDLPLKEDGWQFNWRQLFRGNPKAQFYALITECGEMQGMLMFSIRNEVMPFMDNVEIATHNFGRKGRYKNVAGCLIAYACQLSFEQGKGAYYGYLSFVSKTALIDYYQRQYGASIVMSSRMYISEDGATILRNKYLTKH